MVTGSIEPFAPVADAKLAVLLALPRCVLARGGLIRGRVSVEVVAREKAHTLRQGGLLEAIDVPVNLDGIDGLEAR